MTLRARQIESLITSLDFVTNRDPAGRWKSTCDSLLQELAKGWDLRLKLLPLGPVTALAAYLVFEVRGFDERGVIALLVAIVGTAAFLFAPRPPLLSFAGLLMVLTSFFLMMLVHLQYYWVLALGIAFLSHFVISRFYPALQYEHRIRSLLVYFGYPITDLSQTKLSPDDYP